MSGEMSPAVYVYNVSAQVPHVTTASYKSTLNLNSLPQIQMMTTLFKSVKVVRIEMNCMQVHLTSPDEDVGPHPKGYLRFGVVPEKMAGGASNSFDVIRGIANLKSMALGSADQRQSTFVIGDDVLNTLELDLALEPLRGSKPFLFLGNVGFTSSKRKVGEKVSEKNWELAMADAQITVLCEGKAFG